MSLFLDNDVLAKLASWDLLEGGIQACGFALADVRYLPTAPFWLGLAGKKKCSYPPEVQGRLRAFLATAQACAEAPAGEDSELHKVDNIDAGEAIRGREEAHRRVESARNGHGSASGIRVWHAGRRYQCLRVA